MPSGSRTIARSTSSAATLPDPSQTVPISMSRKNWGMIDSSTKPLPPRHSSASTAAIGPRFEIQYFWIAVPNRRNSSSSSSSYERATRMHAAVIASDSSAMSASTLCISGWSASRAPKVDR